MKASKNISRPAAAAHTTGRRDASPTPSLGRAYYQLTKPGIVYGNDLAAIGGFLLASGRHIDVVQFALMVLGVSLVMAAGCVSNNVMDRNIDRKMKRTKQRALVQGTVPVKNALVYAGVLLLAGSLLLGFGVNGLSLLVALFGYVTYVFAYGFAKRRSEHGTLVGAIPGAVPPVVGYVAVTGQLDAGAALLFVIMVCWQMPHFYAIAMYRRDEYAAAGIPVLTVTRGMRVARLQILVYVALFVVAICALSAYGYTGQTFLFGMATLGLIWLGFGVKGFAVPDEAAWARKMFKISLLILLSFCALLSLNAWVP